MSALSSLIFDLSAVKRNYLSVAKVCKGAKCTAVVKNDAYGFGAEAAALELLKVGVDTFWVAHSLEGSRLRNTIKKDAARIIVFNGLSADTLEMFIEKDLIPVINNREQFETFIESNKSLEFVLNLETGLNRLGVGKQYLKFLVENYSRLLNSELCIMVMSHLANGNFGLINKFNSMQLENFNDMCKMLPHKLPKSLCASNATVLDDSYFYDYVRVGAALYGITDCQYTKPKIPLDPVVFLKVPVLQILNLQLGDKAGYGLVYEVQAEFEKVAVLGIGYADGIPAEWSGLCKVKFTDPETNSVYYSRVLKVRFMDHALCDITSIPESAVYVGCMCTVLDEEYTINDLGSDIDESNARIILSGLKSCRAKVEYINSEGGKSNPV